MRTMVQPDYPWWPEIDQTIRCWCGTEFRGRAKMTYIAGEPTKLVDRECPNCSHDIQVQSVYSDPERFVLTKE